jgi:hypothetical protein
MVLDPQRIALPAATLTWPGKLPSDHVEDACPEGPLSGVSKRVAGPQPAPSVRFLAGDASDYREGVTQYWWHRYDR